MLGLWLDDRRGREPGRRPFGAAPREGEPHLQLTPGRPPPDIDGPHRANGSDGPDRPDGAIEHAHQAAPVGLSIA